MIGLIAVISLAITIISGFLFFLTFDKETYKPKLTQIIFGIIGNIAGLVFVVSTIFWLWKLAFG